MSLYKGDVPIAGLSENKIINGFHIFDFRWSDHQLSDISWLESSTFSWQSGTVYTSAYNHLSTDVQGKTLQSETISGTTVQYYLADDGHKICPASQESNVLSLYNATGVAWYYILDTTNSRFKLPRTKWGFIGVRDGAGKYVEAGLPNITGDFAYVGSATTQANGAFALLSVSSTWTDSHDRSGTNRGISFDASRSSSIYGKSTTVQPPATQMYLYFYVGEYSQTAIEQTAGLNSELFNGKADVNTPSIQAPYLKTTYVNGTSGYNIWSNGYCEQWGATRTNSQAVTFLKTFKEIPIMTWGLVTTRGAASYDGEIYFRALSATGFTSGSRLQDTISSGFMWKATGYLASGQY